MTVAPTTCSPCGSILTPGTGENCEIAVVLFQSPSGTMQSADLCEAHLWNVLDLQHTPLPSASAFGQLASLRLLVAELQLLLVSALADQPMAVKRSPVPPSAALL